MQHLLLTVNHCECIRDKLVYYDPKTLGLFRRFFNLDVMGGINEASELFSKTRPQSKFSIKNILKNWLSFNLLSFTRGDRLNI